MISVAVLGEPRVAPLVGLLRVRFTVSSPSIMVSWRMGMTKVVSVRDPVKVIVFETDT